MKNEDVKAIMSGLMDIWMDIGNSRDNDEPLDLTELQNAVLAVGNKLQELLGVDFKGDKNSEVSELLGTPPASDAHQKLRDMVDGAFTNGDLSDDLYEGMLAIVELGSKETK